MTLDNALLGPLTDEEIHELLTATLHGPLPQAMVHRILNTLAEIPALRADRCPCCKFTFDELRKNLPEVVAITPTARGHALRLCVWCHVAVRDTFTAPAQAQLARQREAALSVVAAIDSQLRRLRP